VQANPFEFFEWLEDLNADGQGKLQRLALTLDRPQ